MKRLFHICISSRDEIMFRVNSDYNMGINLLALALFSSSSTLLADAFMSNHVHIIAITDSPASLVSSFKRRYIKYFNKKYSREGAFSNSSYFWIELIGVHHILAAISYVFRNPLHHGICDTPYGYDHSSVNCIFKQSMGKKEYRELITSPIEIKKKLPRDSQFPKNYVMDSEGTFIRESFLEIKQVEYYFKTPRAFQYYMNRLSSEEWLKEQEKDENKSAPISLEVMEGADDFSIKNMKNNELGNRNLKGKTDIDLCKLIDHIIIKKHEKTSVYSLTSEEKKSIANYLKSNFHFSDNSIKRALVLGM